MGVGSPTAGSLGLLTAYGCRGQRRMPCRLQARFSVVAQMPRAAAASCSVALNFIEFSCCMPCGIGRQT